MGCGSLGAGKKKSFKMQIRHGKLDLLLQAWSDSSKARPGKAAVQEGKAAQYAPARWNRKPKRLTLVREMLAGTLSNTTALTTD